MTTDYEPNLVLSNTRLPLGRSSRWRRRKKDRASYWSKSLVTFCQKQSNFREEMRKLLRFRVRGGDGGRANYTSGPVFAASHHALWNPILRTVRCETLDPYQRPT